MKKKNLTNTLFAAMLLASPFVNADQKYPAADFQPEVVYQDNDYIAKSSPSEAASVSTKKAVKDVSESNETDSKYPAANFQPQVVYSDPGYKHSESLKAVAPVETAASSTKEDEAASVSKKEDSSFNYLIGLVGLALAGAFLFKKRSGTTAQKSDARAVVYAKSSQGLTGVARYLNKVSGTGVSRYLEKRVKTTSATTGVAKYMAKQAIASKTTAVQAATGVEKYMRNRG
ncbi:MAG: hypothetical protein ACXW0Q_02440 [Methylovulum sp.]